MKTRFKLTGRRLPGLSELVLVICFVGTSLASAQEAATRAEADRQRRQEKAAKTQPYKQSGFEKAMHFAEEKAIFIVGREGLYPKLGSLTVGSGFGSFSFGIGSTNDATRVPALSRTPAGTTACKT